MSQVVGAAAGRLRTALAAVVALVVGSIALLVLPSLAATSGSPSTAVLLAVAVATVAVAAGLNRRLTAAVTRPLSPAPRSAARAPRFLADRVTDAAHHPVRPRAPGQL